MKIGEVAELTGTSTKTIRFFEDSGLVPPPARTPRSHRVYRPETADRLRFIRRCQAAGMTLQEVRQILTVHDQGESPCGHVGYVFDDPVHHGVAAGSAGLVGDVVGGEQGGTGAAGDHQGGGDAGEGRAGAGGVVGFVALPLRRGGFLLTVLTGTIAQFPDRSSSLPPASRRSPSPTACSLSTRSPPGSLRSPLSWLESVSVRWVPPSTPRLPRSSAGPAGGSARRVR
ncbi:MerR family transcriptional regulator [Streptomyces sp. NPDC001978]|uniref:MerR family transcriptional regulator n=1 Tax=Streptomyces sp. NPDC001978 TaxID=3364627 RepID=UPI0036811CA3